MPSLPQKYDFRSVEPAVQSTWDAAGVYNFNPAGDNAFLVDTPPPTVSGRIHVGHVFSYTHADIMIRYQRMRGRNIFYPFGFDDNGLPTEVFTENNRGVRAREIGRRSFIEACLGLSHEVEGQFERFWKRLGLSVDWRLRYSTIDERSRRVSQSAFLHLYRTGAAYRQDAPTLWCTTCRTGVAQAEIDDKSGVPSYFTTIPFALDDGNELHIATTRPELLPACVAVFVNPDDERYRHLVGGFATTPIFGVRVPVLTDRQADMAKGTGAVMCCTFGDVTDVAWWREHELPLQIAITPDGRMNALAGTYEGQSLKQARAQILDDLASLGLMRAQRAIEHVVSVHERCGTEIEYLLAGQWFIRVLDRKQEWIDAGRRITWHPDHMRTRYEDWVHGLSWDWNITRQRYYGVAFPVWYCRACSHVVTATPEILPVDPQDTPPPVRACEKCGASGDDWFTPDPDVMDTWATSSLTPQICATLLEPFGVTPEEFAGRFRPMSLRPNAHDIIRTWDFYTIVRSIYLTGDIPWTDVLISGHALDPSGKKISKSKLKAAEDPTAMLEQFSADAVRYWTSSVRTGGDTSLSDEVFRQGSKLVTKLWNAVRFGTGFLEGYAPPTSPPIACLNPTDRWLLARLCETIRAATGAFDAYEFAVARTLVERFFWTDLCDNYLELVKARLYEGDASGAQYTLYHALLSVTKLMAPFIPHVTDAVYMGAFRATDGHSSVHISPWPEAQPAWVTLQDASAIAIGDAILAVIDSSRRWKSDRALSVAAPIGPLIVTAPSPICDALRLASTDLLGVTRASSLALVAGGGDGVHVEITAPAS
jgi:valyl-tRNA synthetase